MTEKFDLNTWLKTYRDAFAPAQRAQAEGFKAFERFARHQYAVAGDYLEFSLHAAKVALAAKTGDDFAAAQVERHLAAGIHAQRLPDGLWQRDLTLGGQRRDFVDFGHGGTPDGNAWMVRKFPYLVNLGAHGSPSG